MKFLVLRWDESSLVASDSFSNEGFHVFDGNDVVELITKLKDETDVMLQIFCDYS